TSVPRPAESMNVILVRSTTTSFASPPVASWSSVLSPGAVYASRSPVARSTTTPGPGRSTCTESWCIPPRCTDSSARRSVDALFRDGRPTGAALDGLAVRPEATPARPEHERQQQADSPHDHQDHADRGEVYARRLRRDRP